MEACFSLPGIRVAGIFQHFAAADSTRPEDIAYTQNQHALFVRAVDRLRADGFDPGVTHCANSAAQLTRPEWRCDLVRAGIILYGLAPGGQVGSPLLRPVMSLKAVVTHVKWLQPGQSASYGRTFTAGQPVRAATVSVGYADGYPRLLSNRGRHDQSGAAAAPVLGRVCMDQTIVDVTVPSPMCSPATRCWCSAPARPPGADTADTAAEKAGTHKLRDRLRRLPPGAAGLPAKRGAGLLVRPALPEAAHRPARRMRAAINKKPAGSHWNRLPAGLVILRAPLCGAEKRQGRIRRRRIRPRRGKAGRRGSCGWRPQCQSSCPGRCRRSAATAPAAPRNW